MSERKNEIMSALREAAKRLKKVTLEIGEMLLQLDSPEVGGNSRFAMDHLHREYGFKLCDMEVWMRVATGEVPQEVASRVPASTVKQMSSETAQSLATGKLKVWSGDERRTIAKPLAKMTKKEITDNITPAGVTPPGNKVQETPRRVLAAEVILIDDDLCVVTRNGPTRLHVIIGQKILDRLNQLSH